MKINLNDTVKVKLTDYGRRLYRDWQINIIANAPNSPPDYKPIDKPEDDAGWSKWQLWVLMQVFGPHITMTGLSPFEMNIEIDEKGYLGDTGWR